MSNIIGVKSAILTALNAMGTIKAAYAFESGNPTGAYPMATLTIRDGAGTFKSTAHNLRRHGFNIRVYQEQSKIGQGIQSAESIVVACLDEMLTHFDLVTTLSGVVKYVEPIGYDARYVDRETDVRILELQLDAYEIVSSS